MGQSSDETRIREMVRRLKRADEREVPPFEDVLGRSVCRPDGRSMRHRQLVFVFAVGAVLLIAVLFVRSIDPCTANERRATSGSPLSREKPAEFRALAMQSSIDQVKTVGG